MKTEEATINEKPPNPTIKPGTIAEALKYQQKETDKIRTAKGWETMMYHGASSFEELFGLTNYQKALKELAIKYEITDQWIITDAMLNSIMREKKLKKAGVDQKIIDTEAYLSGKEVLLGTTRFSQEDSKYGAFEELPSTRINPQFKEMELKDAKDLISKHVDDVLVNIGDPFELVNMYRDRASAQNGGTSTFTIDYSPGKQESNINLRNPLGLMDFEIERKVNGTYHRQSMEEIAADIIEWRNKERGKLNHVDREWIDKVHSILVGSVKDLNNCANKHIGDLTIEEIEDLSSKWAKLAEITYERNEQWRAIGQDPTDFAYDTMWGLSPVDMLTMQINQVNNNIQDTTSTMLVLKEISPKYLHKFIEDFADSHVMYESGEIEQQPYAKYYFEKWDMVVDEFFPDGITSDDSEYRKKFVDMIYALYEKYGFAILEFIDPDKYLEINQELSTEISTKNPFVPKAKNAVFLEEVFPNTSLPDNSVDRAVASWSVSAHAYAVMTKEERIALFAEFDRILKPGGRATIFPMDYNSYQDENSILEILNNYKAESGSNLIPEFRTGQGNYEEHLVLILKKPEQSNQKELADFA